MFKVIYKKVDKKILKKLDKESKKLVKIKKGHSLKEAEKLLGVILNNLDTTRKITLILDDTEEEINYIFADIELKENKPVLLVNLLEKEILKDIKDNNEKNDEKITFEEAKNLVEKLKNQYEQEYSTTKTTKANDNTTEEDLNSSIFAGIDDILDQEEEPKIKEVSAEKEITPKYEDNESNHKEEPIQKTNKIEHKNNNNEEVIFYNYEDYMDISIIKEDRHLKKNNLLKLLNLNNNESTMTELDKKKLEYATNYLNNLRINFIYETYEQTIESLKEKAKNILKNIYEKAIQFNYEQHANNQQQNNLRLKEEELKRKLTNYITTEEQECINKINTFSNNQELELNNFKKQQELEKNTFMENINSKKEEKINLKKEELEKQHTELKTKEIKKRTIELKQSAKTKLFENKQKALTDLEKQIIEAKEYAWEKIQKELELLDQELNKQIPIWKKEILERQQAEQKQAELDLEKEWINIENKKLAKQEKNKEQEFQQLLDLKEELLQKNTELQQIMEDKLKNNLSKEELEERLQNKLDQEHKKRKALITGVLGGITSMLIIGGTITFITFMPMRANTKTDNINLQTTITELEEKLEQLSTNEEDLETLLQQGDYEKALNLYTDKESLEIISNSLYENNELDLLQQFNEEHQTTFSLLDEAILSNNSEEIINILEEMNEETKSELKSTRRKADIIFILHQSDQLELVSKLLTTNNEE